MKKKIEFKLTEQFVREMEAYRLIMMKIIRNTMVYQGIAFESEEDKIRATLISSDIFDCMISESRLNLDHMYNHSFLSKDLNTLLMVSIRGKTYADWLKIALNL